MKKKDLFLIIKKLRREAHSPYIYANYFFDLNNTNYIYKNYFLKISVISYFKVILLFFVNIFTYFIAVIIKSKNSDKKSNFSKQKRNIVIGHKINNLNSDFYFYNLINFFKSKSLKYSLYQINHANKKKSKINLINYYMSFKYELLLFYRIYASSIDLLKFLSKNLNKNNKFYFTIIILTFHLSNKTAHNLRIPIQIKNILSYHNKNSNIFVTFEGIHWERVLFGILFDLNKKNNNNFKSFAVQHSYVPLNKKNFFDFYNKKFNPSHILTSGSILKTKLDQFFFNTYNIGSTKKQKILNSQKLKKPSFIIFLPSSNKYEIKNLLNLILKIHDHFPEYNYIWRGHPFNKNNLSNLFKNYPKIELSYNDLDYDLRRSKLAFYTISSSIINAVCYGVRPIYVENKFFDIDPLEELSNPWKLTVKNFPNLNNYFNFDNNIKLKKFMEISSSYYRKYFEEFKINQVYKLLYGKI